LAQPAADVEQSLAFCIFFFFCGGFILPRVISVKPSAFPLQFKSQECAQRPVGGAQLIRIQIHNWNLLFFSFRRPRPAKRKHWAPCCTTVLSPIMFSISPYWADLVHSVCKSASSFIIGFFLLLSTFLFTEATSWIVEWKDLPPVRDFFLASLWRCLGLVGTSDSSLAAVNRYCLFVPGFFLYKLSYTQVLTARLTELKRERTFRFVPLSRSSCNLIVIHIIEKLWNNNDPTICLDTNFGNGRGYTAFQPQSSSRDFSKRIFSIEKRSFFPNQFSVAIEIPLLWSWIFFLSSRHSFNFVMKPEQ
jgi:hypothetical protein